MNCSEYKILIADDEPDIIEFICYNLNKEGFDVTTATNGLEAIKKAKEIQPHLILLDIMMPGMDGIEVCKELREIPSLEETIIAFLTARSEDYSQIVGFEVGGDDYITKPIRPRVLVSRVHALLRRFSKKYKLNSTNKNIIQIADLEINKEKYLVRRQGEGTPIILPKKEFELLFLLASKPGKVFSREEIFRKIWGSEVIVGNRTIDVHIRKIREKVGEGYIKTIKGIGYKFEF
jgi:two-component system alkaline phosphatase synthesis response regulator PhoP